jgi:hypothetical protein
MADDIRDILKAAQAAEIRGDKPEAIAQLERAAAICRDTGRTSRAVQLLRHALRLDGSRTDLALELDRLEALVPPPGSLRAAPTSPAISVLQDELQRAIDALEPPAGSKRVTEPEATEDAAAEVPPAPPPRLVTEAAPTPARSRAEEEEAPAPARTREKRLIERGPTLADPALDAWCSFCCRPRAEVGALVAGPAGAFICSSCLRESAKLLRMELPGSAPAQAPAVPFFAAEFSGESELLGQDEALTELERALQRGLGWVLLLGSEGNGKTTCLRELERRGVGQYVRASGELPASLSRKVLLLDGLDGLEPARIEAVCAQAARLGASVVLALRGEVEEAPVVLEGNGATLPLFSTQALVSATAGRLPVEVAERIQAVVSLRPLPEREWTEVARRLAAARHPAVSLSAEALGALAAEAARSARGGHELRALIGRIPAGEWNAGTPVKAPRARAKPRRKGSS